MSVSRKKKTMKEVDNKRGVGEVTTAGLVDEDSNKRNNYNIKNQDINNIISSNVQGSSSSVMVDHEHENFEDCRVWWRPGMLVDEQMSWGSMWFSYLDEDANCHAFYSDVVEDDLWDLKSIQHTPTQ
ncbi:Protein trichome birefringence-like 2 [Bienertia sinuspersici]